jgi:hypothetical protein
MFLALRVCECARNVIMSGISKVKMSGLPLKRVRFSFKKENQDGKGYYKDESKRARSGGDIG